MSKIKPVNLESDTFSTMKQDVTDYLNLLLVRRRKGDPHSENDRISHRAGAGQRKQGHYSIIRTQSYDLRSAQG